MDRKTAIRSLMIITGGFMLFPSCKNSPLKASVSLKNFKIDASQENLLAEIASTIIPATDIGGAKQVKAHLFVLKMMDDLYEKKVQQDFITGLNYLEADTFKQYHQSFADLSEDQKQKVLLDIESKKGYRKEVFDFFTIMKKRTVEGYLNSKYIMRNVIKYEFIPSHEYDGYYPVKNL
jgi:hypothetical protein